MTESKQGDFEQSAPSGTSIPTILSRLKAPAERGFGLSLIEQLLVNELGGSVRFDYEPAGVQMRAEVPLANLAGGTDRDAARDPGAGSG